MEVWGEWKCGGNGRRGGVIIFFAMENEKNLPVLEVRRLSVSGLWGGVSFSLEAGGALQIVGGNGAGKTTLLRTLCGLAAPDKGAVLWRKKNIRQAAEDYHAELIYIGHKDGIKDDLTPLENLQVAAALRNSPPLASPQKALAALEVREDGLCRRLSAGQRRRLALARLLLNRAALWLLDEPLTCLDEGGRRILGDITAKHLADGGMVALTSHQPPDWPLTMKTLEL